MSELLAVETQKSRTDVAAILRALADQIDSGETIRVSADDRNESLRLADSLSFELEIERESNGDQEIELELEVEWLEPAEAEDGAESEGRETESVTAFDEVDLSEPIESLGQFQLFKDRADEWRWRLVHRNGNVIATSGEGYTTKRNAKKGIRSVLRNAPGAAITETDESA
ncbi:HVO_2922 family protein [Natronobacterium texcoconense]|uniref:Amphi-Trp domain-containing protein n=1 Tax=Natronobacterium texcoconense TaxID=1095778 RepID=A0A1H1FTG6_NATTX|nr:HVO_2922 family protein [Natronobacterium texcoconense]SDR04257.1 amphi-Trp domain-containing protein [Natronobacterium texcoconense]